MNLPTNIRALGLDMATKTGWASLDGGIVKCGRLDFTPKPATKSRPKAHEGKRLLDFEKWLHGTLKELQPDVIYYEEAVTNKPNTARVLYGFRAVMMARAAHFNIKVVGCHIGTIKLYAAGHGHAPKSKMVATAKVAFPHLDIADDNVADALHILKYGIETNS